MRRIAIAGLLVIAACGDGESSSSVSIECDSAMRRAAAETDLEASDALIVATLNACSSADEWLAALREHPAAMGLTERATIGDIELQAACFGSEETRACRDAAADGRL